MQPLEVTCKACGCEDFTVTALIFHDPVLAGVTSYPPTTVRVRCDGCGGAAEGEVRSPHLSERLHAKAKGEKPPVSP